MERKTGVEPAAFSLARRCSTTELLPLVSIDYATSCKIMHIVVKPRMPATKTANLIRHLHKQLPKIGTVHQSDECLRGLFETIHDVFPVFQRTVPYPTG